MTPDVGADALGAVGRPCSVLVVEPPAPDGFGLARLLRAEPQLAVVHVAATGEEALAALAVDRPDVVLLDLGLPHPGSLAAIRAMLSVAAVPVVAVADFRVTGGLDAALRAFRAGASEVLPRPVATSRRILAPLVEALVTLARSPVRANLDGPGPSASPPAFPAEMQALVVGASAGGPLALRELLAPLPATFPVPIVVIQHITPGFTATLATWLAGQVRLPVRQASHRGDLGAPGIYLCPDALHAELGPENRIFLDTDPRGMPHQPAIDVLFWSAAAALGPRAGGILLTGMGDDGARGLWRLREAGAVTVVQDPATCVVGGMPLAAIARGAATHALSPGAIGAALCAWAAGSGPREAILRVDI